MAKKKSTKKVYKKALTKSELRRSNQSRLVSFIIGAVTVLILGLLVFVYTRTNNYTSVLGTQTQSNYIAK